MTVITTTPTQTLSSKLDKWGTEGLTTTVTTPRFPDYFLGGRKMTLEIKAEPRGESRPWEVSICRRYGGSHAAGGQYDTFTG
jgi:hypothetical protein